jgi:phage gpG-like protein
MSRLTTIIGATAKDGIRNRIRQNKVTPKSNSAGPTLVGKTRNLINSIQYKATANKALVGSSLKYAKIHHTGGTIKPKKATYLTIPLAKKAAATTARQWENTFVAKGCIFHKKENGDIEPIYALKKKVVIPSRPYMLVDKQTRNKLINRIKEFYSRGK